MGNSKMTTNQDQDDRSDIKDDKLINAEYKLNPERQFEKEDYEGFVLSK